MDLRPAEVSAIIKQEIENYQDKMKMESVGTVLQVGDGVARVYGLDDCMVSEILEFPNGVFGIALNLEEDNVGAILLGSLQRAWVSDETLPQWQFFWTVLSLMCGFAAVFFALGYRGRLNHLQKDCAGST